MSCSDMSRSLLPATITSVTARVSWYSISSTEKVTSSRLPGTDSATARWKPDPNFLRSPSFVTAIAPKSRREALFCKVIESSLCKVNNGTGICSINALSRRTSNSRPARSRRIRSRMSVKAAPSSLKPVPISSKLKRCEKSAYRAASRNRAISLLVRLTKRHSSAETRSSIEPATKVAPW